MHWERPPGGEHKERLERLITAIEGRKLAAREAPKFLCFEVDGDRIADFAPVALLAPLKIPPGAQMLRVKDRAGVVRACVDLAEEAGGDRIYDSKRLCLSFSRDSVGFVVLKPSYVA